VICKVPRCGGRIVVGETSRGRRIALDAEPSHDGTYALRPVAFGLPFAEYVGAIPLPEMELDESGTDVGGERVVPAATLYRVHAASCAARSPRPVRGWRARQQRPPGADEGPRA
jgi:hypothetical protein